MNKAFVFVCALAVLCAAPAFAGRLGGRALLQDMGNGTNGTTGNNTAPTNATLLSAKITMQIINATQAIPIQGNTVFAPNDAAWMQIFQANGYANWEAFVTAKGQDQAVVSQIQGFVAQGIHRTDLGEFGPGSNTTLNTVNGGMLTVVNDQTPPYPLKVTYPNQMSKLPIIKENFNQTATNTIIHVVDAQGQDFVGPFTTM